jgi:hypothetical protein
MTTKHISALSAYLQRLKTPTIAKELHTTIATQDCAGFDRLCQRLEIPNAYIAKLRSLVFSVSPDLTWPPLWW